VRDDLYCKRLRSADEREDVISGLGQMAKTEYNNQVGNFHPYLSIMIQVSEY